MTLKPPTRTFPKLVMKEWPERELSNYSEYTPVTVRTSSKSLSDFTRVLEGGQKEAPLRKGDHE